VAVTKKRHQQGEDLLAVCSKHPEPGGVLLHNKVDEGGISNLTIKSLFGSVRQSGITFPGQMTGSRGDLLAVHEKGCRTT